jgi:hypothetical protein
MSDRAAEPATAANAADRLRAAGRFRKKRFAVNDDDVTRA